MADMKAETARKILVRNATLEDLGEINTIIQNNFHAFSTMQGERLNSYLEANSTEKLKEKQFDNPNVTILVAEVQNKIVGVYIFEDMGTYMKSKKAHVLPEYQKDGVITELASVLVNRARSKGMKQVHSKTTKEALDAVLSTAKKLGLSVISIKHNCEPPFNYTLVKWSVD